jgi:hypothetical protein
MRTWNTGIVERWNNGKVKIDTGCWSLDVGYLMLDAGWQNIGIVQAVEIVKNARAVKVVQVVKIGITP